MPLPSHAEIPEGLTERERSERFRWFTLLDIMILMAGCAVSGAFARERMRQMDSALGRWTAAAVALPSGLALVGPLILSRQWV